MYRPKRIPNLQHNIKTGLYEISEDGITYSFDFTMLVHLKNYLHNGMVGAKGSIASWYKSLKNIDREKVEIKKQPN